MADFLNRLIQRSGVSPARKEDPVILRPRLPALFEALPGPQDLPLPPSDRQAAASSPVEPLPGEGRAALLSPPVIPAGDATPARENRTQVAESIPARNGRPSRPEPLDARGSMPGRAGTTLEPPAAQRPAQNVISASPERPVEPLRAGYTVRSRQRRQAGNAQPARLAAQAEKPPTLPAVPQGTGETQQPEPARSSAGQAGVSVTRPAGADQAAAGRPTAGVVIRPRVESARPLPVPTPAQASLKDEPGGETVVQIRIGRIDVRAAPPPAAPTPARAAAPQPKMSLEDYLRRRENQR
jgi:hypothetical protein